MSSEDICYGEIAEQYWEFENNLTNDGTGSLLVNLLATGSVSYIENDYGENSVLIPSGSELTFDIDVPTYGNASGSYVSSFLELRYRASAGSGDVL